MIDTQTYSDIGDFPTLPKEYWPCPLCLIALLRAHGEGVIDHEGAYRALENSGLVQPFPGVEGRVTTTERGRKFMQMLEAVPLPVQEWIDPRVPRDNQK